MKIEEDIKLDFSDVLIKPKRSLAPSRSKVNLTRRFDFPYCSSYLECIPLIAANMDTTGSLAMSDSLSQLGCLTAFHKFYRAEEYRNTGLSFVTIGIKEEDIDKLEQFKDLRGWFPPLICIDVANGYTEYFVEFVRRVRDLVGVNNSLIMAGNVATAEMTQEIIIHGKADIVKIGIGPGSVCTTRFKTGVGVPQLSAIAECADVAHGLSAHICADGGCKQPGDVAKAFGAGADFVMLGGMLAGTDECEGKWKYDDFGGEQYFYYAEDSITTTEYPYKTRWPEGFKPASWIKSPYQSVVTHNKELDGKIIKEPKKKALAFHGMSSREAMELHNGGVADYKTPEGIEVSIPYKGKAEEIIKDILGGIRGTCTMVGADNLKHLPKCCTFQRVNRVK